MGPMPSSMPPLPWLPPPTLPLPPSPPRLTLRLPTLATTPPPPPPLLSPITKLVTTITITRAIKDDRLVINQDAISNLRTQTNLPKWAEKEPEKKEKREQVLIIPSAA